MKEKVISYIKANRGSFSLLLITFFVTVVFGLSCGALAGGCCGTITMLVLDYMAGKVGMMLGDSAKPGIAGIAIGILVSLIF